MIIVFICIALWIVCGVSIYMDRHTLSATPMICATLSGVSAMIISIICIMLILCNHVAINNNIMQYNIQYNSLCKRLEIINSEYEDVSKSDVIADIAEWNKNVVNYKYWANSPWTNWFYSKEIADHLQMIEY